MSIPLSPIMIKDRYWGIDIAKVEALKNARYVGEFPGKGRGDSWVNFPVAVFYQAAPNAPFTNHYFGLYQDQFTKRLMICDADYVQGVPFTAINTPEGIVYSSYRHDYREVGDQMIDGGWDYVRHSGGPLIRVCVIDGQIVEVQDEETD